MQSPRIGGWGLEFRKRVGGDEGEVGKEWRGWEGGIGLDIEGREYLRLSFRMR